MDCLLQQVIYRCSLAPQIHQMYCDALLPRCIDIIQMQYPIYSKQEIQLHFTNWFYKIVQQKLNTDYPGMKPLSAEATKQWADEMLGALELSQDLMHDWTPDEACRWLFGDEHYESLSRIIRSQFVVTMHKVRRGKLPPSSPEQAIPIIEQLSEEYNQMTDYGKRMALRSFPSIQQGLIVAYHSKMAFTPDEENQLDTCLEDWGPTPHWDDWAGRLVDLSGDGEYATPLLPERFDRIFASYDGDESLI